MKLNLILIKLKMLLIVLIFLIVSFIEGHYTMKCKVYSITPCTPTTQIICVEDPTENLWDFYYTGNANKIKIGQDCKVLFNNHLTETNRHDDSVDDVWFK